MNTTDSDIYTLHRYFIWANRLKDDFKKTVQDQGPPPAKGPNTNLWLIKPFTYFSQWMAMLYVVCEGWSELELSDTQVTPLLQSERIKLLKRYRNGVFHFQKKYFDQRFTDFLLHGEDVAQWADDLHSAFSKYFLKWNQKRGVKVSITDNPTGIHIKVTNASNKRVHLTRRKRRDGDP